METYKGRLIKADPNEQGDWYVYCVGAEGMPVLYIGISPNASQRY